MEKEKIEVVEKSVLDKLFDGEISKKEYYQNRVKLWMEAEEAVLIGGQKYKIGSRDLTRADLGEIRRQIKYWWDKLEELEDGRGGKRRIVRAVPRDL